MSTASKRASARKTYRTEWVDRWSPPKPLVGLQAIEKVLNRHTFLVCPESRLVVAVLNFPRKQIGSLMSECLVTGFHDEHGRVALCVEITANREGLRRHRTEIKHGSVLPVADGCGRGR